MAVYIVTYDLNKETQRPNIVAEVKKTDWARLSESSYAINTHESVDTVRARFNKYIDGNDYLFTISLKRPWNAYGPKDVIAWLEARLPW